MEQLELLTHVQALNRSRIERLSALSPSQQQPFFELLPLLFHLNSADLPGYIEKNAPVGIVDYQPSKSQIDVAKKLYPGFQYRRRALRSYPIVGLYLINNSGLINYQNQSSFELLLVHATDLTDAKQQALQYKLMVISQWAASFGIAITTRLLAENALAQHPLSSYELDRFYLNGLIVAGAIPLWWFIPPGEDYHENAPTLLEQRSLHIRLVDFGDVPHSPSSAQPLFDEAIKCLENSLEHGLMHVLQLLHLQYHLRQYPNLPWLSTDLKQAIYQGETEPLHVDYRSLQLQQLVQSDAPAELLQLARQSFYIQAKERLSQSVDQPKYVWRRTFVAKTCQKWQWRDDDFKLLDQRSNAS
ncbi:MAG: class I adenylate cyclase, partial [Gammaproteobacteria bacterium]|nr:class I adenylate cyclase [Gammaproteobacteria bacterium]